MVKDLTKGKAGSVLVRYSLPLLVSVIFQQIYNMADSIIAGQFSQNGENALAAVGASYPITMIFMAFALGCNIGCSIIIAQLFGEKRSGDVKSAVYTSLIGAGVLCVILTGIGFLTSSPILHLLNTPADIFADTKEYLDIYIGGLIFLFLYNITTGIFTALGDSKTPLYFLIASSLLNIALDVLFVAVFHWDVAGVAWATFIAQGLAAAVSLSVLMARIRKLPADSTVKVFDRKLFVRLCGTSVPSILQQSFVSVGNLLIQGLINGFGSATIAGFSAAIKLNTFAITCFMTLANGISGFTAQNLGAGQLKRVKTGAKYGVIMEIATAVVFIVPLLCFSPKMIELFVNQPTQEALDVGSRMLYIVTPFFLLICLKISFDGVLRGAAAMKLFMITTFTDMILRVVLSYCLTPAIGMDGIFFAWPISWGVAAILSMSFYFSGIWKKRWQNTPPRTPSDPQRAECFDCAESKAEIDPDPSDCPSDPTDDDPMMDELKP